MTSSTTSPCCKICGTDEYLYRFDDGMILCDKCRKEPLIEPQYQVVNDNTGEIVYTGNLLEASRMRSWYNLKHENIDNGIFFSTKYANSGEK